MIFTAVEVVVILILTPFSGKRSLTVILLKSTTIIDIGNHKNFIFFYSKDNKILELRAIGYNK